MKARSPVFKSSEIPAGLLEQLRRHYPVQPTKGFITRFPGTYGWLDKWPSHEEFIDARNARKDLDEWFFNNGVSGTDNHAIIEWD